jgi:hypothetical protein
MKSKTIVEIKTTFGGPCIYKRAIFSDGSHSGLIQYVGQSDKVLDQELFDSAKTGRNDCESFIDRVMGRR